MIHIYFWFIIFYKPNRPGGGVQDKFGYNKKNYRLSIWLYNMSITELIPNKVQKCVSFSY